MTRTLSNLLWLLPLATAAQQPLILLDPSRGGANSGAEIANRVPEKQVTLDLADRLASLLRARGFAVSMTRDSDVDVASDARAALANNTHPMACILLYAAPGGMGVHLYTTAQKQIAATTGAVRWDEAQGPYADRSRTLANDLRSALDEVHIPASTGQTWMRPLDNMQCPAVAVELLPEKKGRGADDSGYQSHVANAVANTLLQWRAKVAAMAPPAPAPKPVAHPVAPATDPAQPEPSASAAPTGAAEPKAAEGDAAASAPVRRTVPKTAQPTPKVTQPAPTTTQPAPVVRQPAAPADRTQQ